ncbi:MAG: hypothetical protein IKH30_15760 [Clostridia bacterium]|nr:hypothetical protein [Clostridia bacterium]
MQDNQTVLSRRNSRVFTVLLCAVGLLINFLGVKFALALKLPVFLDVIGSALTAALGGYIPGIMLVSDEPDQRHRGLHHHLLRFAVRAHRRKRRVFCE